MPPFSAVHKVLDHPLFLSISILNYHDSITDHKLIGSGKIYMCFIYGDFNKINTDGSSPTLGEVQIQPVENYFIMGAKKNAKLITLAIKPYYWYNITGLNAKDAYNTHFNLGKAIPELLVKMLYSELTFIDCPDLALSKIDNYFQWYYTKWTLKTPINDIVEEIFESQGKLAIKKYILKEYPIGRSTLNSYFDKYIGVSPKFFIKLVLFNNLLREVFLDDKIIADIIKDWNYYDYSHLKKDVELFTGIVPRNLDEYKNESLQGVFENVSYW